jgi:hypothetical protein
LSATSNISKKFDSRFPRSLQTQTFTVNFGSKKFHQGGLFGVFRHFVNKCQTWILYIFTLYFICLFYIYLYIYLYIFSVSFLVYILYACYIVCNMSTDRQHVFIYLYFSKQQHYGDVSKLIIKLVLFYYVYLFICEWIM